MSIPRYLCLLCLAFPWRSARSMERNHRAGASAFVNATVVPFVLVLEADLNFF